MKKRIKVRRLIGRRSYSTTELAKVLEVHPQTIRSWRVDGLNPIDPQAHHSLYLGEEVRRYYRTRERARKVTLKEGWGYCFRCKSGQEMVNEELVDTGRKMGNGAQSMRRVGNCVECGTKICRFDSKPAQESVEREGINIDGSPPLYHSLESGKD